MKIYLSCILVFILSAYTVKKGWVFPEEECELVEFFEEAPVINIPDLLPVSEDVRISSNFGMRIHPIYKKKRMHYGIDFPLKTGTPIRAAGDGVVQKVVGEGKKSSYGKHIQIGHDPIYSSLYAHLSNVYVVEGQMIQKGDTIGLSGNTGVTSGPHLHFEVFENGKHINPLAFWHKNASKKRRKERKEKRKETKDKRYENVYSDMFIWGEHLLGSHKLPGSPDHFRPDA